MILLRNHLPENKANTSTSRASAIVVGWMCVLILTACHNTGPSRYSSNPYAHPKAGYETPGEQLRSPLEAEKLTLEATDLIDSNPKKAEQLLRQALTRDLYHGPAHNNLGVLYLKQGMLYEAANEFEWARKLMPGHPDPRLNLALTLEQAGKINEALATYDSALEAYPNYLPAVQALARLQIREHRTDERTHHFLEEISLRSNDNSWKSWARFQLAKSDPAGP